MTYVEAWLTVLAGNLAAMAFPLFTTAMYKTLGYHWAGTLFACIASIMVPIPYVSRPRLFPLSLLAPRTRRLGVAS